MGSIGLPEILVVLVIALIVLGPNRLPDAARQAGKALSEFRRVSNDLQREVRTAFDESPPTYAGPPPAPVTTTPRVGDEPAGRPTPASVDPATELGSAPVALEPAAPAVPAAPTGPAAPAEPASEAAPTLASDPSEVWEAQPADALRPPDDPAQA